MKLNEKGEIVIDLIYALGSEVIQRELSKTAIFDAYLLKAYAELAKGDSVDWGDDDPFGPWTGYTTGPGTRFKAIRRVMAEHAETAAATLCRDLLKERDDLVAKNNKLQSEVWRLEDENRKLMRQLREEV